MNMNGGSGSHMHGMAAGPQSNGTTPMMHRRHMMMHMTFFWGKNAEILFDGWPGNDNLGMYILALAVIFFFAFIIEWLSNCRIVKDNPSSAAAGAGLLRTLIYAVRIGLAYLVMLAVMSFNAGVFLVAVAGHAVGFFVFGSRAFTKQESAARKSSDLPPMSC